MPGPDTTGIAELRTLAGITRKDMAEAMGISTAQFLTLEKGRHGPIRTAEAIGTIIKLLVKRNKSAREVLG
jgi:transcriptional regulator with XRE-family HTH domain